MATIVRNVVQQYENYIEAVSGCANEPECLVFVAPLNAEATKVVRGSVVSLNDQGEFVLGLTEGQDTTYPMPMFSKKNAYDPDVATTERGETTGDILANSIVGSKISAYVATGAFELETSEFVRTAQYAVNQALIAAEGDDQGKVVPATEKIYGAKTVLGIVSKPPFHAKSSANVNSTALNRLCFWPVFFPPTRS